MPRKNVETKGRLLLTEGRLVVPPSTTSRSQRRAVVTQQRSTTSASTEDVGGVLALPLADARTASP
jgi:hypothetical protein